MRCSNNQNMVIPVHLLITWHCLSLEYFMIRLNSANLEAILQEVSFMCSFQLRCWSNHTPRYFTCSTCLICRPSIFMSIGASICRSFWGVPTSKKLVLSVLRDSLLWQSHDLTLSRSLFIVLSISFGFKALNIIAVSSAYNITLLCSTLLGRSFIKRVNSRGPSIEP